MTEESILNCFIQKNPLAVMTRCIVQALSGERLDQVFEEHRTLQYDETIKALAWEGRSTNPAESP